MAEPASCDLTHDLRRMKCVSRAPTYTLPPPPPALPRASPACLFCRAGPCHVPADLASSHIILCAGYEQAHSGYFQAAN